MTSTWSILSFVQTKNNEIQQLKLDSQQFPINKTSCKTGTLYVFEQDRFEAKYQLLFQQAQTLA